MIQCTTFGLGSKGNVLIRSPRTLHLILYELHLLHPDFHESHRFDFVINYFGGQPQIIALSDGSSIEETRLSPKWTLVAEMLLRLCVQVRVRVRKCSGGSYVSVIIAASQIGSLGVIIIIFPTNVCLCVLRVRGGGVSGSVVNKKCPLPNMKTWNISHDDKRLFF